MKNRQEPQFGSGSPAANVINQPGLSVDAARMMRYDANKKSTIVTYLLWSFLGFFGAHRFYLGRVGSAFIILLVNAVIPGFDILILGLQGLIYAIVGILIVGIWLFIDVFLIPGMVRDYNNDLVTTLSS